jgi:hypothetical protein
MTTNSAIVPGVNPTGTAVLVAGSASCFIPKQPTDESLARVFLGSALAAVLGQKAAHTAGQMKDQAVKAVQGLRK